MNKKKEYPLFITHFIVSIYNISFCQNIINTTRCLDSLIEHDDMIEVVWNCGYIMMNDEEGFAFFLQVLDGFHNQGFCLNINTLKRFIHNVYISFFCYGTC